MTTDYAQAMNDVNEDVQSRLRSPMQPVDAHYYPFTGEGDRLNAGLLVLLDSRRRAIRAELHFYAAPNVQTQNAIMRQAQTIVGARYVGGSTTTPLAIIESGQQRAVLSVAHQGEPQYAEEKSYRLWPIALGLAIVVIVVLAIAFSVMLRLGGRDSVASGDEPTATLQVSAATGVPITGETAPDLPPVDPAFLVPRTNNLLPSKNAHPNIEIGTTVRIKPQLRSFIRSEAGSEQGTGVGYLQDGDTTRIIGGPIWLAGDADTIVWWYVQTPDGVRGWTPANTSQLTLLEPMTP